MITKRYVVFVSCCLILSTIYSWNPSEGGSDIERKQKVNFYGIIETQQGSTFKAENISINSRYKQIVLYERPKHTPEKKPFGSHDEKAHIGITRSEIPLTVNPRDGLAKVWIDLDQIISIEVVNPNEYWTYQRKGNTRKLYYLELHILKKNGESLAVLIKLEKDLDNDQSDDRSDQIKFNTINIDEDKSENMSLPFLGLKKLTIKGYCTHPDNVASSTPVCNTAAIMQSVTKQ